MNELHFPPITAFEHKLPVYVTSVGHWDHQEPIERKSGFIEFQWIQTLAGEGILEVGGKRQRVSPGQGIFLYPRIPHSYMAIQEPWEVVWFSFDGSQALSLAGLAGFQQSGVFASGDPAAAAALIGSMLEVSRSKAPYSSADCSKMVYSFMLDCLKAQAQQPLSLPHEHSRLMPVIEFIQHNLEKPLTLEQLSGTIGVTPQHLCLLFRKAMHMRPMEYVNRQRIQKSKDLLFHESGVKLGDVARQVGFEHHSYFTSLFKKFVGYTPEQYKELHGIP